MLPSVFLPLFTLEHPLMFPRRIMLEIELAELLLAVDDTRAAAEPFKLPAYLRTLVSDRLTDMNAKAQAAQASEGTRSGASMTVRQALDTLEDLVKQGFQFLEGLIDAVITDAERQTVMVTYGWNQAQIGRFTDPRIETMANLAVNVTPTIPNTAHRYPDALVTQIGNQLAILNANQPLANFGSRSAAIDARDEAYELLESANERGRYYYCSASDLKDQTPELARIGRQPRRPPGAPAAGPLPGPVVGEVFDPNTLTFTLPALPENATTIRAYRQVIGGQPVLADASPTTTVSVIHIGPLDPGTSYEFWVVGHNNEGEGPPSARVQFTAP